MFAYVLALIVTIQSAIQPSLQDEIKEGLLRAESLYYEAKFVESIQILARVNDALAARPDRLQDKIATKLQLALANIGLNDTASAKIFLSELYALDSEYAMDSKLYSPKVVSLAQEARSEQQKIRCEIANQDARRSLAGGDSVSLLNTLKTMKPKCANLGDIEPEAAELVYRTGLAAYKQNDFPSALRSFQSAQKLSPRHELAGQYVELTQSKLQVAEDRLVLQWQKNFDSKQYRAAASDYRQILAFGESGNPQSVTHMTREYRKAMTPLIDTWNRTCPSGDMTSINQIKNQFTDILPEPTFADDLQAQMRTCPPSVDTISVPRTTPRLDSKTDTTLVGSKNCLQMDSQLALTRLKTRVDPEIPAASRAYVQNSRVTVRVKARIEENGAVTVVDAAGSNAVLNNSVRTAVERWKFNPIADKNGPRCVDTEIPVVLGR